MNIVQCIAHNRKQSKSFPETKHFMASLAHTNFEFYFAVFLLTDS